MLFRSGDMIKIGRRGSLNGRVVARGRQGHVAYPTKADNPIPALLRVLQALLEPLDAGTPRFDASNLEITSVDVGNPATNVIPAVARARLSIRYNDLQSGISVDGICSRLYIAILRGSRAERLAPRTSASLWAVVGVRW